jgi:hypothetical protein
MKSEPTADIVGIRTHVVGRTLLAVLARLDAAPARPE